MLLDSFFHSHDFLRLFRSCVFRVPGTGYRADRLSCVRLHPLLLAITIAEAALPTWTA